MLRLITFGGLRIENGAVVNAANPRSRQAILAVIAAGGAGGVSRERLTTMFWPDSADDRARNALRQALFVLKRDSGGGTLTDGVTHLRLDPATISSDVGDFEQACKDQRWEDAVRVYAGPFLQGVYLREAPEFQRWMEEQQQRRALHYGRALEALAVAAHASGDTASAVRWRERGAAHDPLSAKVALALMKALVANGERERALQHAAAHAARVRSELEMEPDAEVEAFATSLRATSRTSVHTPAPAVVQQEITLGPRTIAGNSAADLFDPAATSVPRALGSRIRHGVTRAVVVAGFMVVGITWWRARAEVRERPSVQVALAALKGDTLLDQLGAATVSDVERHLASDGHVVVVDTTARGGRTQADWSVATEFDARNDSLVARTRIIDRATGVTVADLSPVSVPRAGSFELLARVRDGVRGAVAALTDTLYQPWAQARSIPPNYAAFQAFMRGLDAVVIQGPVEAAAEFRRAIVLDPDFVEAKLWYLEQADALDAPDIDLVLTAARAQYDRLGSFDRAALDRQDAFIHGHLEATYTASRRMYALAPTVQDAQWFLAHAAMATRRYRETTRILHRMDRTSGWLSQLHQAISFDLISHRLLGEVGQAISEWRALRDKDPQNLMVCREGVSLLGTAGDEAGLETLIAECDNLPDAPKDPAGAWELAARMLRRGGHDAAATRAFERALAIRRTSTDVRPGTRIALGVVLAELGRWEAAYREFTAIPASSPQRPWARLGVAAAHVGDTALVREVLAHFEAQPSGRRGTVIADEARGFIYAALGQHDEAIRLLRRARDRGRAPGFSQWYARFELEPLRRDPRFRELIAPQ